MCTYRTCYIYPWFLYTELWLLLKMLFLLLIAMYYIITEINQDGEKNPQSNEKSASPSRPQHSHSASSKQNAKKLDTREIQHAFVLYASGEKKKDTGSQKTHNVCAPAQENEIHESALKAKNRRQKEKRKQLLQKQRAHSADAERVLRRKPSPVDDPWMTEYMRCYSARAR
ncbi:hypothetical protein GDO78_009776 [Eleutherodactylus coqui]|uniref:Uncharacterized protein n=1 Tax=Eleutherodactylus coqui TaxID=57060 RepID=A0A8J6K9Y3_ELECQ|nr:hypothetical protein GDO78_009776 [Eleutherodactylus coqui]